MTTFGNILQDVNMDKTPHYPLNTGSMILKRIGNKLGSFLKIEEKSLAMEKIAMVGIHIDVKLNEELGEGITLRQAPKNLTSRC